MFLCVCKCSIIIVRDDMSCSNKMITLIIKWKLFYHVTCTNMLYEAWHSTAFHGDQCSLCHWLLILFHQECVDLRSTLWPSNISIERNLMVKDPGIEWPLWLDESLQIFKNRYESLWTPSSQGDSFRSITFRKVINYYDLL